MLKSTIALLLAATLVACGGNNPPVQRSGPQTQQPPGTKGAPTDVEVAPEAVPETTTAIKALG